VSCIADYFEFSLWEGEVQVPGTPDGTHHVVPALNYHRWNVSDFMHVLQQLVVTPEKTIVKKIMVFYLSERQRETITLRLFYLLIIYQQFTSCLTINILFYYLYHFPSSPLSSCLVSFFFIFSCQ
jgi:hypothetical protein